MLRNHAKGLHRLLLYADFAFSAVVFLALVAQPAMRPAGLLDEAASVRLLILGLVACVAWPLSFEQLQLYVSQRRRSPWEILARLFLAGLIASLMLAATAFTLDAPVAPAFPFLCGLGQLAVLGVLRLVIFTSLRVLRRRGHNCRNLLIIGSGPRAARVWHVVERHPEWGLRVVGFVDDSEGQIAQHVPANLVRKMAETASILQELIVDEVIVACPRSMLAEIDSVVAVCGAAGVPVTLLMDLFEADLLPRQVTRFESLSALSFAPVHHNTFSLQVKRVIDVIGASLALVAAAPAIGIAALAIRCTSPGPLFFRQKRCGLNGRTFDMLKLRTMYVDAEERKQELVHLNEMDGPVFKIKNDPRITPVGCFLRRFSLDELPQFWNVLLGDMSLVGPRPPVPSEVNQYDIADRRRLSMRPGITCLWQVNGRNAIGFADWVKLDLQYIDTWSLSNDLRLLMKTLPAVIRGSGS